MNFTYTYLKAESLVVAIARKKSWSALLYSVVKVSYNKDNIRKLIYDFRQHKDFFIFESILV